MLNIWENFEVPDLMLGRRHFLRERILHLKSIRFGDRSSRGWGSVVFELVWEKIHLYFYEPLLEIRIPLTNVSSICDFATNRNHRYFYITLHISNYDLSHQNYSSFQVCCQVMICNGVIKKGVFYLTTKIVKYLYNFISVQLASFIVLCILLNEFKILF